MIERLARAGAAAAAGALGLLGAGCPEGPPCTDEAQPGDACIVAGTGDYAFSGDGERATEAGLYEPTDVAVRGGSGEFFIADWNNHRVRHVDGEGVIQTVVGTEMPGDGDPLDSDRTASGAPGTTVGLNHPVQVEWDEARGLLLLPNWHNHRIRTLDPDSGTVRVRAADTDPGDGNGANAGFAGDGGPASAALMAFPISIGIGPDGDYFLLAQGNLRVRFIAGDWSLIQTVAGSGTAGYEGDGGDPLLATFRLPPAAQGDPGGAVEVDGDGVVWVADTANHCIRKIDLAANVVSTVAGNGSAGYVDGALADALFSSPRDVELGADGRLYVADTGNHAIRAVDLAAGTVETVAGTGVAGMGEDGLPALETALDSPYGIDVAPDSALFIADTRNSVVRRVTP